MKSFLLFISMLLAVNVIGQSIDSQVIGSLGGHYTTTTYSASWTVGEVVIQNYSQATLSLSNGFQQSVATLNPPATLASTLAESKVVGSERDRTLQIYPNPVSDLFIVSILNGGDMVSIIGISVINVTGILMESHRQFKSDTTQYVFSMKDYMEGVYIIKVNLSNGTTLLGKVIKI